MAVRREALLRNRLSFSDLFGGGCLYCSGEDTIFIRDCFRAGLRVYSYEYVLGACAKDSSSWFQGYDEKYFYDRGAMLACAFPAMKGLLACYYAWKLSKKTGLPAPRIFRNMCRGIRGFRTLTGFQNTQGESV